jgi:hypothetical protein
MSEPKRQIFVIKNYFHSCAWTQVGRAALQQSVGGFQVTFWRSIAVALHPNLVLYTIGSVLILNIVSSFGIKTVNSPSHQNRYSKDRCSSNEICRDHHHSALKKTTYHTLRLGLD